MIFLIFVLKQLAMLGYEYIAIIFIAILGSFIPIINLGYILKNKPHFLLTDQGINFTDIGFIKWQDIEKIQEIVVVRMHRASNYWIQIDLKQDIAPEKYKMRVFGLLIAVIDVETRRKIRIWPYLSVGTQGLIKHIKEHLK